MCQQIKTDKAHDDNWSKIACTDGVEQLVLALRSEINNDLNDFTVTTSALQMTKSDVLSTVDFVALQLLGNPQKVPALTDGEVDFWEDEWHLFAINRGRLGLKNVSEASQCADRSDSIRA